MAAGKASLAKDARRMGARCMIPLNQCEFPGMPLVCSTSVLRMASVGRRIDRVLRSLVSANPPGETLARHVD